VELYKQTTALEDWVTAFYKRLKIYTPTQINIEYIARIYEIYIHRKPLPADHKIIGRYRGITIDTRKSKKVQREMFFHEFCHILRHAGIQSMMPEAFRELQEWDANSFVRYAAIPHHMLKFIDFDDPYVIDQMVSLFKVTPELCEERLLQIKKKLFRIEYMKIINHNTVKKDVKI
jgi:Zn-dependent peptidase ImmA (M78 family)